MTCLSCAHCDRLEGDAPRKLAGFCTKFAGWFNGKLVPVWMVCPEYEAKEATHVS